MGMRGLKELTLIPCTSVATLIIDRSGLSMTISEAVALGCSALARAVGTVVLAMGCTAGQVSAATVDLPKEVLEATWRDSDGKDFQLGAVHEPVIIVTMAYTACRRVCGTTTLVLSDLQRRLDAAHRSAQIIVVSFDPTEDSPQDWQDYRQHRGLTRDNWHFLSGSDRSTHQLARYLDMDYWRYHDHIVHNFRIAAFDAHWHVIGDVDWARMDDLPRLLGLPQAGPGH